MKLCKIGGCTEEVYAQGMCSKHFMGQIRENVKNEKHDESRGEAVGFELLTCADCPHVDTGRCPVPDASPEDVECAPRTDWRKALVELEKEKTATKQGRLF